MATQSSPRANRAQKKRTLTQQTISAISGLFKRAPKAVSSPAPLKASPVAKISPQIDPSADQATLAGLLARPNSNERDLLLANFAAKTDHASLRWEAAQAVDGETGWKLLQADTAGKDRRVAKFTREKLAIVHGERIKNETWLTLSQRYIDMVHAPVVDVRHFMDLDKDFDKAQKDHPFDLNRTQAVESWRAQLQSRLQTQTATLRTIQAHRDALKTLLSTLQADAYKPSLHAEFEALSAQRADLPQALGVLPLQRLLTEIDALSPQVAAALSAAARKTDQKAAVQAALQKVNQANALKADIEQLQGLWRKEWAVFTAERITFDTAISDLKRKQLQAREQHASTLAQRMEWLATAQAQLAAALDAGQGQTALKLADEINERIDLAALHASQASQAADLDRLLAQVRETRNLLWEGAARERQALIAKAQALAEKPLLPKYQAQTLKDLQNAWKALKEKSGAAPHADFAVFKSACDTAYVPVKAYLDGQRKVMAQGTAQRQAQIDELSALLARVDWATVDWAAVEQLRQEARTAWRSSLPSDYKQRDALTKAHDEIMALLEDKLAGARQAELARRERLTQEALALASKPFVEQHVAVRTLMERYNSERSGVYMPRSADQAAWNSFKSALDAVYSRRDEQRKQEASENEHAITSLIQTKQAVLAQLKSDTQTHALASKPLQNALNTALAAWDEPGRLPRGIGKHNGVDIDALVKDWLAAVDEAKAALHTAVHAVQKHRISHAWELALALDTEGTNKDELIAQAQGDEVLKKAFAPRLQGSIAKDIAALETAILDAEIATGVPSPEAYKAARMQRQVQRLSDKLTGSKQHGHNPAFTAWLNAVVAHNSTQGTAGERLQLIAKTL